jgi:hypothetical protein
MSLHRVPLDSSNERQHRTVIATTVNELVKVRPPFDQTEAEVGAGVTPLNPEYPPGHSGGHIFRFIPRSEHAAILGGTSTYDASEDIQRCIDSLNPGDTMTIVGFVPALGLLLKTSDIHFTGGGWLVPANNDASATVLTIGDDSDNTLVRRISGHLRIGDITTNYTNYTNITGLKLVRCVEFNLHLDVTACAIGLDLAPTESAVAYNDFFLGMVYNNKIGIRFNPSGTDGYTNDNTFHKGRFSHGSALSGVDLIGIQFNTGGTFPPDNNVFYAPTFEHKGRSVEFNESQSNRIVDARYETLATSGTAGVDFEETLLYFGADSLRNTLSMSMNTDPFVGSTRNINHGAATRVTDYSFTIASDLTSYFYPGAICRVTTGSGTKIATVIESSFSSPNMTVTLFNDIVDGNPTAVRTARIENTGTDNIIRWDRHTSGSADYSSLRQSHLYDVRYRSALYLHGADEFHPALSLTADTGSNHVLRALDGADVTAYLTGEGHLRVARFGLAATPAATQSANADTSGATLGELETEVNELKAVLRTFGLIAT